MLAKLRDFGYRLIEISEALLIIPTLLCILVISLTIALPQLAPIVVELAYLIREGELSAFDGGKLNILALPVLAFLAIALIKHMGRTTRGFEDVNKTFDDSVRRLIDSVRGVEFITFDNEGQLKGYLNRITEAAQRDVADFTWAHKRQDPQRAGPLRSAKEQREWEELEDQHAKIVSEVAQTRRYREIFILGRHDRIEKLQRRWQDGAPRYACRVLPDTSVPRLQFVIVDEAEVVFVSDNHKVLCSIKHPQLVSLLLDYFEDAWAVGWELVTFVDGRAVWDDELTERVIRDAQQRLKQASLPRSGSDKPSLPPWVRRVSSTRD